MPPLHPADDSLHRRARPGRRTSRAAAVLAGTAVVLAGSALPALAMPSSTPSLPASCGEIATATPGAPDGDYRIVLAGARTLVHCADMAGTPRAYLTLPNPNYSAVEPGGTRDFTRVHVVDRGDSVGAATCAADACIDIFDQTFSSAAGDLQFRYGSVQVHSGVSLLVAHAKVDLRGTPFAVGQGAFSQVYFYPSRGSSDYSSDNQVVDISGAGSGFTTATDLLPLNRIAMPSMSPAAPTAVTAARGHGSATLTVTPGDDGGSSVTAYEVSTDNGATYAQLATTPGSDGTVSGAVTGLTDGTSYTFLVRAINAIGVGATSTSNTLSPVVVTPPAPVVPARPTISGPAATVVEPDSTVTVSGTAPAGSTVQVWFRQRNHAAFTVASTVVAGQHGTWRTSYVASDDYRYFAENNGGRSATVLTQLRPSVNAPAEQVVRRNSTVVLTGNANPGSTVGIHFHKKGTAASDYSIVRTVTVDRNGKWVRPYLAATDYRLYLTSNANRLASRNILIQAR